MEPTKIYGLKSFTCRVLVLVSERVAEMPEAMI